MSYIKMIGEEKAEGKLKEAYKSIAGTGRKMSHVLKIQSLSPKAMVLHYDFYREIMFGKSDLTRRQREMIALVVSAENNCFYWITHHGAALYRITKDKKLIEQIKKDFISANISQTDKAILEYAVKLTSKTCEISENDINPLHKVGLDDKTILDVVQIVVYFNFATRLACGLGIELEEYNKNGE